MIGLKDFDGKELTVNQTWDPVLGHSTLFFHSRRGFDSATQSRRFSHRGNPASLWQKGANACGYYDVLQASGLQQNIHGCPQGYHKKKIRLRNLTSFNALIPFKFYLIHYET
jgi:hypothetical protein